MSPIRPAFVALALALVSAPPATADTRASEKALEIQLEFSLGLCLAPDGTLYVVERAADRIRRIDPAKGTATIVAGNGSAGFDTSTSGPAK